MRRPGGEEWPKLIAEYETSGQMQKEFCADRDLPFNTFQYFSNCLFKKLAIVIFQNYNKFISPKSVIYLFEFI